MPSARRISVRGALIARYLALLMAPGVRFNFLAIFATPDRSLANIFNVFTRAATELANGIDAPEFDALHGVG
jgi:hypothetical protein